MGHAPFASVVFNMSKVALASSVLTVSLAVADAGLFGGCILMAVMALMQYCSLEALWFAMGRTRKIGVPEGDTFADVALDLYGYTVMELTEAIQSVFNFGILTGWLVIIGNQTAVILTTWTFSANLLSYEEFRVTGMILAALIMFMLSAQRSMSGLKWASMLGLICVLYLIIVVIIGFFVESDMKECGGVSMMNFECTRGSKNEIVYKMDRSGHDLVPDVRATCQPLIHNLQNANDTIYVSIETCLAECCSNVEDTCAWEKPQILYWNKNFFDILKSATIIAFSYINQVQFVSIVGDMQNSTTSKGRLTIVIATLVTFIVNSSMVFGYLSFCDFIEPNILDNYSITIVQYLVARVAFVANLLLTAPLFLLPVRDAIYRNFEELKKALFEKAPKEGISRGTLMIDAATPLLPTLDEQSSFKASSLAVRSPTLRLVRIYSMSPMNNPGIGEDFTQDDSFAATLSRHIISLVLLTVLIIFAFALKDLGLIIGLVGAIGGGMVLFTLPAIFAIKRLSLFRITTSSIFLYIGLGFMVMLGIIFTILGTICQFY